MVGRAKATLTQRTVDAAKASGKPYTLGDASTPGLRLWVGRNGTKRWQRRIGDETIVLGDAATIPLEKARQLATGKVETARAAALPPGTIGTLVGRYLEQVGCELAQNTRRERVLRQYLEPLLARPIEALTRQWLVERRKAMLGQGLKGSTVVTYTKGVRAWVSWLTENDLIVVSPFRRKLPIIPVNRTGKALDDQGKYQVEVACQRSPDHGIAALVMLSLGCGMRKGEITQLEWNDIDLNRRVIHVRAETTKTRKDRWVAIPVKIAKFVAERRGKLPAVKPFDVPSVDWRWARLRASAHLDTHIRFHDLRHTFVSVTSARGGDLKAISEAVGHSSTRTTEIYLHTNMARLRKLAALVDQDGDRPRLLPAAMRDRGE